jgi:hypothetical protein
VAHFARCQDYDRSQKWPRNSDYSAPSVETELSGENCASQSFSFLENLNRAPDSFSAQIPIIKKVLTHPPIISFMNVDIVIEPSILEIFKSPLFRKSEMAGKGRQGVRKIYLATDLPKLCPSSLWSLFPMVLPQRRNLPEADQLNR